MVFGATAMCGACSLRFAPRSACPSCGGPTAPARRRTAEPGLITWLVQLLRALFGVKQLPSPRLRVHEATAADDDFVRGIARASTVTVTSPIGKVDCLAFGLRGEDVADADGGDFDVELPSGERVQVSLEHAILVGETGPEEIAVDADAFLEARGIVAGSARALGEVVLRDGDRVMVTGKRIAASIAVGDGKRARVITGDADRPLAVRIGG